jgi:hypothetical protein
VSFFDLFLLQILLSLFAWWLNERLGGFDFLFFILQPLTDDVEEKDNKKKNGKNSKATDLR